MKKSFLLLCLLATSLVGCDMNDNNKAPFQYNEYAYVVNVSSKNDPKGLVAFEVSYVDADGSTKTKTITESWSHVVPATDKFVMKLTSKMVLAPGAEKPTSGKVNYYISEGIAGAENGKPIPGFFVFTYEIHEGTSYSTFNKTIDKGEVRSYEYEIKPMY